MSRAVVSFVVVLLLISSVSAFAQSPERVDAIRAASAKVLQFYKEGKYATALPLALETLKRAKTELGEDNPDTISITGNLAALYHAQGNYSEAEPLLKSALEAAQRLWGQEDSHTLVYVNNLASLYQAQGHFSEAEPLYIRALETRERLLPENHPDTLISVNNLATLYQVQGRYREAERLFKRALDGRRKALGENDPSTIRSVNNLASVYHAQGRFGEAEPLFKSALERRELVLGIDHPDTLRSVNNLAGLYHDQGRYGEVEPLYVRALEGRERVLGKEHRETLSSINNLAGLYQVQGRYAEAEPLFKRARETYERVFGQYDPDTLTSVHNLAGLYQAQGRYTEAELLYQQALERRERTLGPDHRDTLRTLNNLAFVYQAQGRYAKAEPLYQHAFEGFERALGSEHPDTLTSVNNLAELFFEQGDWPHAALFWQRSTGVISAHAQHGSQDATHAPLAKSMEQAERSGRQFSGLIKAAYRLEPGNNPHVATSYEMFRTAQWAQNSQAAQSLADMVSRGAKGDLQLAALVRERQDLEQEWRRRDEFRITWLGLAPEKRNDKVEAENITRLEAIDRREAEIDSSLKEKFPDYFALVSPAALSAGEVHVLLRDGEALVLFLDTVESKATLEETFIWVVTKSDVRWVRSDLGTSALTREVQALRCGLDASNWADSSGWSEETQEARQRKAEQAVRRQRCIELTGISRADASTLPFDRERAFKLYKALFGEVEDLIKGKQLLLVPSGPLTQLPFQVLITEAPDLKLLGAEAYRQAAWLIRDHALTVLPAVSSLKALRRVSKPSLAARPMIGFGNPLLDGPDKRYAEQAKLARENQHCRETPFQRIASFFGWREGVVPVTTRSGLADVSHIRKQIPLPETAQEVCDVARGLGADPNEMRLGSSATKREVKRLSEEKGDGRLSNYRIIHFATHGALAGQLSGTSEPGLILTPPKEASEEDDGYLSASDVAGLKLDADLVILSACNTAAGDAKSAEALSGLARAFIYAQGRSLLVSHWPVNSQAAVPLITTVSRAMGDDRKTSRAEALRQGIRQLIKRGEPWEAHPAHWAPFVLVGDGGAQE